MWKGESFKRNTGCRNSCASCQSPDSQVEKPVVRRSCVCREKRVTRQITEAWHQSLRVRKTTAIKLRNYCWEQYQQATDVCFRSSGKYR